MAPSRGGFPNLISFAIHRQGSPQPAVTTPTGCALVDVAALHPDPEAIAAGLSQIFGVDGSLALQLRFSAVSESVRHHDSEVMGWREPRSRRRLHYGPRRCGM